MNCVTCSHFASSLLHVVYYFIDEIINLLHAVLSNKATKSSVIWAVQETKQHQSSCKDQQNMC